MTFLAVSSRTCTAKNHEFKTLIFCLAVIKAVIDLLRNHRQTKEPEAIVKIDMRNGNTHLFCITARQLFPGHHAFEIVGTIRMACIFGGSSRSTQ